VAAEPGCIPNWPCALRNGYRTISAYGVTNKLTPSCGNPDLIGLYLRPDAAPWEKRFPDDYYRALAHITRTDYTGHIGGTPAVFGQLTERWVYAVILPADVHEELRTRHGESQKMHQWLSNGGVDLLDKQLQVVATIARTSSDLRDFTARMMALPGSSRGQLGFIWPIETRADRLAGRARL